MNGGFWDKLGNEYEKDYVCLQWLRLLSEHVDAVTWEGKENDEKGVDVWLEFDGRRTAVQCKSRSGGQWTASSLAEKGFLPAVREHLERTAGADRFVFVTNQSAPPLTELRTWACSAADTASFPQRARRIAKELQLAPDGDVDRLRALAMRIDVDVQAAQVQKKWIHDLAASLAGEDGERLVRELMALRAADVCRRTLRVDELRLMLPADLRWRQGVDSRLLWEKLERARRQFVDDVHNARRIPGPPLGRPETRRLLDIVRRGSGPGTVLVHGGAGAGKSDVLASAVENWPPDQGLVVPIRADECERFVDGDLSLERLVVAGGAGRVTLVIDQLDQLRQAGLESQRLGREATRLVREAQRLGCRVIVGCRTIDAEHDTQLHKLLHSAEGHSPERLLVGDLPEREVTAVLSQAGIAWSTLGPGLRRLALRPVCLGFMRDLVAKSGWQGAHSLHEFVSKWWGFLVDGNEAKAQAMRALIERMELDGSFAVDRSLLPEHDSGIDALLHDGVLQRTAGARVRPVHQVLVDTLLARELGDCTDAQQVLERIGPLARQGVQQARRLRLAASLLAARDTGGATILDTLYRSRELRPLLERALLLGLADDPLPPSPALVRVVLGWLDDRDRAPLVSGALLRGRGTWVVASRAWLESAWRSPDLQDLVLQVLASVSAQEGDLVAELLGAWTREDPGTWERASRIFWQDPTDDSDALFEMRDRAPGRIGFPNEHPNWARLIGDNPVRAARTLARQLEGTSVERLVDAFGVGDLVVPGPDLVTDGALAAADRMWGELRAWWIGLEIESLVGIASESGNMPAAPLVDSVALLAKCLAHMLERGDLAWVELLEQLPDPLRDLDGWLLLEVGANLSGRRPEAAEAASLWLIENERFVGLRVGRHGGPTEYELARPFVRAIAAHLSEHGYARLERWILEYREEWSADAERGRLELNREHGLLWPNGRGLLCYRLLPELPAGRLTLAAKVRLEECRRKFDPVAKTMLASFEPKGGAMGCKVPDHVARGFDAEKWIEHLRAAPNVDWNWSSREEGSVEEYTFRSLSHKLFGLAQDHPRDYLPTARAIASAAEPRFAGAFYANLLQAVSTTTAPGGASSSDWAPAPNDEIESLVRHPALFRDDECAIEIGRIVQHRAEHAWSQDVIDRLVEIATRSVPEEPDSVATVSSHGDTLTYLQWNDAACVAVRALACLASKHAQLHDRLLGVAEGLVEIAPLARRAAAAILAMHCDPSAPERARGLLMRACRDTRVAADRDCLGALFWVLGHPGTTAELRDEIVATLTRLPAHDDAQVAERGGICVVELRSRGLLEAAAASALLWDHSAARKGAAGQLGRILHRGEREPWIFDHAIELAEDDEPEVGDTLLRAAVSPSNRAALIDPGFGARLVRTAAARRHRARVLRAFDDLADLGGPVAELVFEVAKRVLTDPADPEPQGRWKRFEETRNLGGLLARLVEECEKTGDDATRSKALDAWDVLVSKRPFELGPLVGELTNPTR